VLLMAAIAYVILQHLIIVSQGSDSVLKQAVGKDWKGKLSPFAYLVAILVAPWSAWLSQALYVGAALVWFVPDRRIEHVLHGRQSADPDDR